MKERRKHIRIDLETKLEYEILPLETSYSAKSKNISESGLCFLCDRKLEIDTILYIHLELPIEKENILEAQARVVWQKKVEEGFLTGIEFRNLDFNSQMKIQEYSFKFFKEIENYLDKNKK